MHAHSPNSLIHETSVYLLQHAQNPVQWLPWGPAAFEKARLEDKPMLVSIGYAACHWCHVMERESFEDEKVAAFMNAHFINVKVDREERPDVDHFFMDAVQTMAGNGGWPLNVFVLPDGKPFYGGTYFPPTNIYNRPSWMDVLQSIQSAWKDRRNEIDQQAANLLKHLRSTGQFIQQISIDSKDTEAFPSHEYCQNLCEKMLQQADGTAGGFGVAPKFPQFFSLQFLLGYSHYYNDQKAFQHAVFSLKAMLRGGIYDQLGGGIARYSTDAEWLAPHFEKMLYDNALLINILCDAYALTADSFFQQYLEKTIQFCLNEMQQPQGGFFASLDADSEGVEGKYYVWQQQEIQALLGEDAGIFCDWFGVKEGGNWEGTNILHCPHDKQAFLRAKNLSAEALDNLLSRGAEQLLSQRSLRIRPATDDKVILSWNALLVTALCKSAAVLQDEKTTTIAIQLYQFLSKQFVLEGQIEHHIYHHGQVKHPACLDDYAYLIQAAIHLQELTGNQQYLLDAQSLMMSAQQHFVQSEIGFFYYTQEAQQDILVRKVDVYDSATPAGNSVMANNLYYLGVILDVPEWKNQALQMLRRMKGLLSKYPNSFGNWSFLALQQAQGISEIVITGQGAASLGTELRRWYFPAKILQIATEKQAFPLLTDKDYGSSPQVYLCRDQTCFPPQSDLEALRKEVKLGRL